MGIPNEQELRRMGIDADEWLKRHDNEIVEECIDKVDRLMLNTICNPKLKETEKIDVYLQCIRDAKKAIKGESNDRI